MKFIINVKTLTQLLNAATVVAKTEIRSFDRLVAIRLAGQHLTVIAKTNELCLTAEISVAAGYQDGLIVANAVDLLAAVKSFRPTDMVIISDSGQQVKIARKSDDEYQTITMERKYFELPQQAMSIQETFLSSYIINRYQENVNCCPQKSIKTDLQ